MEDKLFNEIITELQRIHEDFPDLRFGLVIQNAMDMDKKKLNDNLLDRSSKQILTALENFNIYHKNKRKQVI